LPRISGHVPAASSNARQTPGCGREPVTHPGNPAVISPFDLSVFGAVSVLIGITVLLASLVPARRATALQPVEALRDE